MISNESRFAPTWRALNAVAAIALALRIAAALWSEHLSHPDEIFQYFEQAHRLVYGYGFLPWEYRFGVRNWLLPGTLAGFLDALRLMGADQPSAYVPAMRCILALVSVSVVYASYTIGRNLFDEKAGRIAALLAAIWYEVVYAAELPTPEVLATYAIFGAFALYTKGANPWRAAIIGLLLGGAVVLRVQYSIPAAALWLLVAFGWGRRPTFSLGLGSIVLPVFAGALDWWTWGAPFRSYYNYITLSVFHGLADTFGSQPFYWFAGALTVASLGLHPLASLYGLMRWRRSWTILLLLALVLLSHSFVSHKEYRFIFLAIPLLLVLWADLCARALPWLAKFIGANPARALAVAALIVATATGYRYRPAFERDDRLLAILDLSKRDGVAAVADLSGPWYFSGGFYYLHHDVPYYFSDQLDAIGDANIHLYVSHALVRAPQTELPGFKAVRRVGTVTLLEQETPPPSYERLSHDGRVPFQKGVDDRFPPPR